MSLFPDRLPGQRELNTMCQQARRVTALCDAIDSGRTDLTDELLEELPVSRAVDFELVPEDGAWLLPPEDDF